MKRVVSISLGSSKRDHQVEAEFLGERFRIERIGTDGDMERMVNLIRELDGQVDAFGLGGMDLYIRVGTRRYLLRDAAKIVRAARLTPMVDGGGLKDTLERRVITYLAREGVLDFRGKKVLMVSAVDRFGMAEALDAAGAELICGDLIFGLGIPVPIRSLSRFQRVAYVAAPFVRLLPFKLLYPTGKEQEKIDNRYQRYYEAAEIIAGDFLFIRRYLPPELPGRVIITNTVTSTDIEELRRRGIKTLITTTPEFNGRSFGTNVMEGVLLTLSGKKADTVTPEDYNRLLDRLDFKPRIVNLT
ncbi:quinate 5-dehydrogenase [Moorella sulfitireducens (nom. illeg.)]|uniref:quinate 5-dehydrogenase n=1 Tax=Neomoorella sulfitireducens TaxID=2972948 RepID=UPI0021ABBC4B|nr:quinate 5-dehydrogenase [Moorella sulfitireducens]